MALRKNHVNDKAKSGINYILNCPVRFNVSSTADFKARMEKHCLTAKTTIADLSRGMMFDFFEVRNFQELTMQNTAIRKSLLNMYNIIKDEMGLSGHEFSKWFREAFTKLEDEK